MLDLHPLLLDPLISLSPTPCPTDTCVVVRGPWLVRDLTWCVSIVVYGLAHLPIPFFHMHH